MTNQEIVSIHDDMVAAVQRLIRISDRVYNADDRANGMMVDYMVDLKGIALTELERELYALLIRKSRHG